MPIDDFNLLSLVNRLEMDALRCIENPGSVVSMSPKETLLLCRSIRMLSEPPTYVAMEPPPLPEFPGYAELPANRAAHEFEAELVKKMSGKR